MLTLKYRVISLLQDIMLRLNLHSTFFQNLLSVSKINEKAADDAEYLVMMLYDHI